MVWIKLVDTGSFRAFENILRHIKVQFLHTNTTIVVAKPNTNVMLCEFSRCLYIWSLRKFK